MNDKEIEAIRLLNLCLNSNAPLPEEALSWVKIVLNLIDKLQKENDFLKAPFEYGDGNTLHKRYVEMNFISKDKIRNKIKEYKEADKNFAKQGNFENEISVLQELLEEE